MAVRALLGDKVLEAALDVLGVDRLGGLVGLAATQQRQEAERGGADLVLVGDLGRLGRLLERAAGAIALAVLGEFPEGPVPVVGLVRDEPGQAGLHRRLGLIGAAVFL